MAHFMKLCEGSIRTKHAEQWKNTSSIAMPIKCSPGQSILLLSMVSVWNVIFVCQHDLDESFALENERNSPPIANQIPPPRLFDEVLLDVFRLQS